jgi:hypothetical protein
MDAGDSARTVARTHARAGTTAFLATTVTAPIEEIERALAAADRAARDPEFEDAAILIDILLDPLGSQHRGMVGRATQHRADRSGS